MARRNNMNRRPTSRRRRRADAYEMNSDHRQPPYDAYAKGDPEAWAEGKHPSDLWLGEEPRDEIGMGQPKPDWGHHSDERWNEGTYDNQKSEPAMEPMMMARRNRKSKADIRKKAFRCVKIAKHMLAGASEEAIEDQAVELMTLSSKAILATLSRIRKSSVDTKVEDTKEAKTEESKEKKVKAALTPDEVTTLKSLMAKLEACDTVKGEEGLEKEGQEEEGEEEEGGEEMEMGEVGEEGEELLDEGEAAPAPMPEGEAAPAPMPEGEAAPALEDEMLEDLMGEPGLDVEMMAPPMMEEEVLPEKQYDQVLQGLFDEETGEVKAKKSSRKPVKKLGGSVKVASKDKGGSDLSTLWHSDPDVSDVFKD